MGVEQKLSSLEGASVDVQYGVGVSVLDMSPANQAVLTFDLDRLGLMHQYTTDTVRGDARSLQQVYDLTVELSIGVAAMDGANSTMSETHPYLTTMSSPSGMPDISDVQIFAPALQTRNKKNSATSVTISQSLARDFAIETARLLVLKKLKDSGLVSDDRSQQLANGMPVEEAIREQKERFTLWKQQTLEFQARPDYRRARPSPKVLEAVNRGLTRKSTSIASYDKPAHVWQYQSKSAVRTYALVATAVTAAIVLSACGGQQPSESPAATQEPNLPPATAVPTTEAAQVSVPEVIHVESESGVSKSVIVTTLNAESYTNLDKTYAPNAVSLFDALKAKFAEENTSMAAKDIGVTYLHIQQAKTDTKEAFDWEVAFVPLENPSGTQSGFQYAKVAFMGPDGTIVTGNVVINNAELINQTTQEATATADATAFATAPAPSSELTADTFAAQTMRFMDGPRKGQLLFAITVLPDGTYIYLYLNPNDPTKTLALVSSKPSKLADLLESLGVKNVSALGEEKKPALVVPDPSKPEGTVQNDGSIKMENGDIARKVEYKTASGEVLWTGWAIEKTQPGGIPLLDIGGLNAVQTRLFVQPNIPGSENILSLTHPDNLESSTADNSLTGVVDAALQTRMNILGDNTKVTPWFKQVSSGTATLPIITSTGEAVDVLLGPDTGFITIVVPYESLDPATVGGVTEWQDPYPESRASFRSTVLGVDQNGNAICLLGSKTPLNALPDNVIRLLSLFHAGNMINDPDQRTQEWSDWLSVFVTYADAKGNKTVPDIIIIRR